MIRRSYRRIRPSNASASPFLARSTRAVTSGASPGTDAVTSASMSAPGLRISMSGPALLERAQVASIVDGDHAEEERTARRRQIDREGPHVVLEQRRGAERGPAQRLRAHVDLVVVD